MENDPVASGLIGVIVFAVVFETAMGVAEYVRETVDKKRGMGR